MIIGCNTIVIKYSEFNPRLSLGFKKNWAMSRRYVYHPNGPTVLEIHERYVADFNPFGDSDKNPATLATLKQKFKLESSSLVKRLVISGDFRKEKRIKFK